MDLEKGISYARKLASLKQNKDKEFYSDLIFWLEELKEYKNHANDEKQFHGMSDTRLYHIWSGMKARCYNATSENYKYYGGRGIRICNEWLNSFMSFYNWAIKNGYSDDLSIDRINVDKDYSPNNCRWTTAVEQARNKQEKSIMRLTYKNTTLTINEWSKRTGIKAATIRNRLDKGWAVEKVLETPIDKTKSHEVPRRKK